MRKLLVLWTLVSLPLFATAAPEKPWEHAPPQPVYTRFQRNMPYQHDRGFFLSSSLGPAWVQSLQNPTAQGIRFFGDFAIGGLPGEHLAIHATLWGSFLTEASAIMVGPGLTWFLPDNWALAFAFGIGQVMGIETAELTAFRESVLGLQFKAAKYWWVDRKLSLGISLAGEAHGFSFILGQLSTLGFSAGPRFELVFN